MVGAGVSDAMSYTGRVFHGTSIWERNAANCLCGRPMRNVINQGPLAYRSDHDEVTWRRTNLDLTQTEARMVALWIQGGYLSKMDLTLAFDARPRPSGFQSMIHVTRMIWKVRKRLEKVSGGEATIETTGRGGFGENVRYRLVINERPRKPAGPISAAIEQLEASKRAAIKGSVTCPS